MKKIFCLVILPFLLLIGKFGLAQNCDDWIKNSGELKIDCGGPDCVPCLQLNYSVQCEDTGSKNITVYFPVTDDYIYAISGNYNEPEYIPAFNNYQINMIFADAETFIIRVEQNDLLGNTVAQTVFGDEVFACTKLWELYECPPNSEFDVSAALVYCEDDSFMVTLTFTGGVPYYQVVDTFITNAVGEENPIYIDAYTDEENILLGPFPDGYYFDIKVVDSAGCEIIIDDNYDFDNCQFISTGFSHSEITNKLSFFTAFIQWPNLFLENGDRVTLADLALYDLVGHRLWASVKRQLPTGQTQIELPENYRPGIYLLQIQTDRGHQTIKLNLP